MPLTFETAFDCGGIIIIYEEVVLSFNSLYVFIFSFYSCLQNLFKHYFELFLCSTDLFIILKTSSAYLHSLVDSKTHTRRHADWRMMTPSYIHGQTGKQTCSTFIFSLRFISPQVIRQPIFAVACCYLRAGRKVVMEGWLRPVTSCSFTPGTGSGKVMAKPARCSSHF